MQRTTHGEQQFLFVRTKTEMDMRHEQLASLVCAQKRKRSAGRKPRLDKMATWAVISAETAGAE